jgi:dihydropteroate synthase
MKRIKIMGILNVTPDSFYDGGAYSDLEKAFNHGIDMISHGADIIDIGGESSRPGAAPVSVSEEIDRVCPVIERLKKEIDISISVDTCKAEVARAAIELGADMVNDISGLAFDADMGDVIADNDVSVVLMHMKGSPETMQNDIHYSDVISEIKSFLFLAADKALAKGVAKNKIILDPGIGFGKSLEDNYKIIHSVKEFKALGYPVLIGLSQKSLIGNILNADEDRLSSTVALNTLALNEGADIIRVHDVKEHKQACRCLEYYFKVEDNGRHS